MSNCPTGSEVGIAWLGTLCQVNATGSGASIVSGTAVSTAGLTEWQVIAHEMGHNFGAIVSTFSRTPVISLMETRNLRFSTMYVRTPASNHVDILEP